MSVAQFLDGLPQILGAQDLREVIERIVKAHQEGNTIILGICRHLLLASDKAVLIDNIVYIKYSGWIMV